MKIENISVRTYGVPTPIPVTLYDNNSDTLVMFINGDGRTGDFNEIADTLNSLLPRYDYLTFFFRGVQEQHPLTYRHFIADFIDLLDYIKKEYSYKQVILVCTSSGALTTTFALQHPVIPITKVIYLDPADYYLPENENADFSPSTWDGSTKYVPNAKTVSDLMKNIDKHVCVNVVGFILRNTKDTQYAPIDQRGIDQDGYFPRLNQDMVKAFFDKTPQKNQSLYLKMNGIPHAYVRDGDVKRNIDNIVNILMEIL